MDVTKTHVAHDLKIGAPVISCRFDPTGKFILAGSQDFKVWRVQPESGELLSYPTEAWVRGIAMSSDGETFVTAGYDGRLMWWSLNTTEPSPRPLQVVDAHKGWVRAIAISPDNQLIASVGNDHGVRVWDMASGKKIHDFAGHESHVYNVQFHPNDPQQLVSGDLMANIIHWDLQSGEQKRTWKAESLQKFDKGFVAHIGGFRGMTFSADGSQLLCSGITNVTNAFAGVGNPSVVTFDWASGEQKIEHLSKGKIQGVAWGVVAHTNGTHIAVTGGSGGYLLFWKPDEANEFHNLKLKDVGRDLDLSSDDLHLAVAHHNGHISVCRMEAKVEA